MDSCRAIGPTIAVDVTRIAYTRRPREWVWVCGGGDCGGSGGGGGGGPATDYRASRAYGK